MSNCSLGILKISTQGCLKKHERFREIPNSTHYTLYCTEKDNKEILLTWTLNLSSAIVKYNSETIIVDLPGNVYDSFISGISHDCCERSECWLKYRWQYDTTSLDMVNPFSSFKFPPLTRQYLDTTFPPSSWYNAQKMCSDQGYYLPILDNYNKIAFTVKWIKAFAFHFPINSIFIGIQKLVSLMYFHYLLFTFPQYAMKLLWIFSRHFSVKLSMFWWTYTHDLFWATGTHVLDLHALPAVVLSSEHIRLIRSST